MVPPSRGTISTPRAGRLGGRALSCRFEAGGFASFFGLRLSNVPLTNIRFDFNSLLALFRSDHFRRQFAGFQGKQIPVKTHYFTWHGRPNLLLTYFLRESIVGLESAISGAIFVEAIDRGMMTPEILEATKRPSSLGKHGTAASVFNGLPALIDVCFRLETMNADLWDRTRRFYKEVRNPVFHAYEIASDDPEPVWKCLELIWELFRWLNSWHPISKLTSGPIAWSPAALKGIEEIPTIDSLRIGQIIPARSLPEAGREHLANAPSNMTVLQIEEVNGLYIGTHEMLDIGMTDHVRQPVKVVISPHAAMRLLAFLALAQSHRGWEIPDRL
jgi:hypothetical protein